MNDKNPVVDLSAMNLYTHYNDVIRHYCDQQDPERFYSIWSDGGN